MSVQDGLRNLAAQQDTPAPWDFETFERRRARAAARQRAVVWGSALSFAVLAMVGILALVTQPRTVSESALTTYEVTRKPAAPEVSAAEIERTPVTQPALIDMSQFDVTSELEDRIALLDAELSAARVERVPAEQLRRIESTREQMNESLQRVSYAHALLSL